jgi:hypothetical protein
MMCDEGKVGGKLLLANRCVSVARHPALSVPTFGSFLSLFELPKKTAAGVACFMVGMQHGSGGGIAAILHG